MGMGSPSRLKVISGPARTTLCTASLRNRVCPIASLQRYQSTDARPTSLRELVYCKPLDTREETPALLRVVAFARSVRSHKRVTFLALSDGSLSGSSTLQAVIRANSDDSFKLQENYLTPGVALELTGYLKASKGRGQALEFDVKHIQVTGTNDSSSYPVQIAGPSTSASSSHNDLYRRHAHLRPREPRHASILRARDAIERGVGNWFWENEFTRVAAPILTSSDCEGGGEVFRVEAEATEGSSADESAGKTIGSSHNLKVEPGLGSNTSGSLERGNVSKPCNSGSRAESTTSSFQPLERLNEEPSLTGSVPDEPRPMEGGVEPSLSGSQSDKNIVGLPSHNPSQIQSQFSSSFFGSNPAYLTVSSQLHLESLTMGLGRVWTSGPSFRAEKSATNRHLSEFWMVEGEQITSSGPSALEEVMDTTEGVLKRAMCEAFSGFMVATELEGKMRRMREDIDYLWKGSEETLQRLEDYASSRQPWPRITYSEAIDLLGNDCPAQDLDYEKAPAWGDSFSSSHERWLADNVGKGPIFVTHYPSNIKPFYMRVDESGRGTSRETVACFDLLVPRIGELAGGSLREEKEEVLLQRIATSSSNGVAQQLQWYVRDLRRHGSLPHGGFGIGLERLVSWCTNTDNLRDVVTFPRVKGNLRY